MRFINLSVSLLFQESETVGYRKHNKHYLGQIKDAATTRQTSGWAPLFRKSERHCE
jgi:hypothetical protein